MYALFVCTRLHRGCSLFNSSLSLSLYLSLFLSFSLLPFSSFHIFPYIWLPKSNNRSTVNDNNQRQSIVAIFQQSSIYNRWINYYLNTCKCRLIMIIWSIYYLECLWCLNSYANVPIWYSTTRRFITYYSKTNRDHENVKKKEKNKQTKCYDSFNWKFIEHNIRTCTIRVYHDNYF